MTRADDSRGGVRIFSRALLAVCLIGALAVPAIAAATANHRTRRGHRVNGRRGSTATVLTSNKGKWGLQLVVEMKGQKLSLFNSSNDSPGKSTCNGKCAKSWYPLIDHGSFKIDGSGINKKAFKTFKRSDGSTQIEYYGQPLYRCRIDTKTGENTGADAYQFGASWGVMGAGGSDLQSGSYGGEKHPKPCG